MGETATKEIIKICPLMYFIQNFAIMAENRLIDCDANPSNPACVPK
jgi:hypothetical protein